MSQDEYGTSWERARDFGEAMLGIPSYADDSMMMVMRYVTKVKETVGKTQSQDFVKKLGNLTAAWSAPAEEVGGPEPRARMIEEARGKCHDIVKGFPELDRDYDEFLSALRGTLREAGGSQV